MMNRRTFLWGLTLATLAAPLAAEAQQAEKLWRVGFLEAGSSSVNRHFLDAFRQGLSDLAYVEGQQITIEDRWAQGQGERFPALVAELIQLNVDAIVVVSSSGALAAKNATRNIPIIFVAITDPL